MISKEFRKRALCNTASLREQQLFGNPILNPGRGNRKHVGDFLDFVSAQTLGGVPQIPQFLPNGCDSPAEPFSNQCHGSVAVDGPQQVVHLSIQPWLRLSAAQSQSGSAFLDRIPGPCRLQLPDRSSGGVQASPPPCSLENFVQFRSPAASLSPWLPVFLSLHGSDRFSSLRSWGDHARIWQI